MNINLNYNKMKSPWNEIKKITNIVKWNKNEANDTRNKGDKIRINIIKKLHYFGRFPIIIRRSFFAQKTKYNKV